MHLRTQATPICCSPPQHRLQLAAPHLEIRSAISCEQSSGHLHRAWSHMCCGGAETSLSGTQQQYKS